jgi:hypothetical protein
VQLDIPVQTNPPETAVTAALRTLARIAGWCVTHTTDGQHAPTSYHYVGQAVDLADRAGPGVDTAALSGINAAVLRLVPLQFIRELIYAGPGGVCVRNGRTVNGLAAFGAVTMSEHHNHVHLAVAPSFTYQAPEAPMPDAPPDYAVSAAPISIAMTADGNGYLILCADGGVFAFGTAKYLGRVHKA